MGDDERVNPPNKKSKVMVSTEDLQLSIEARDKALIELNYKFEVILKENEKLRKTVDDLVKKLEESVISEYEEDDEGMNDESNNSSEIASNELKRKRENDDTAWKDKVDNSNEVLKEVQEDVKVGKNKHVPIVTAYNINVRQIGLKLEKILGHKDFNIKILGKDVTNIGVCTLGDFKRLKALLKEDKVDFYTYTPKEERPVSVVVRGLSGSFEEREVINYMEGLQIRIRMIGLTKLSGDRWLFRIGRDSDIKSFRNIRYILHCRVFMEKYKRRQLIQCFNCQRFGHVAINCNMPYRCVKCGGGHGPGKCEVPPRDENNKEILTTDPVTGQAIKKVGLPIKCANCGIVGHVASSKECPKRQELLRRVQSKRDNNLTSSRKSVTEGGMSYAAVARSANIGKTRSGSGLPNEGNAHMTLASAGAEFDLIDGDCKRLFGGGLLNCLGKIRGFAREYKRLGSDGEKSRALLGMLMSLQHDD